MAERKLFKTKLCVLYRKGRCHRQNCSFAHGNAELRQSMPSRYEKKQCGKCEVGNTNGENSSIWILLMSDLET